MAHGTSVPDYTRPALRIALAVTVASFILGIGFAIAQGIFAILSDIAGAGSALAFIPVVWALHVTHRASAPNHSGGTAILGLAAMGLILLGSLALVIAQLELVARDAFPVPPLGVQFLGVGFQGLWFLALGALMLRTGSFEPRIAWAAIVAGAGYAVGIVAVAMLGFQHPLTGLGFVASIGGLIAWAVWLLQDLPTPLDTAPTEP